MATPPYTTGTITLTNGSAVVTGSGTAWQTALIMGGVIYVQAAGGNPLPILTVDSNTQITAAIEWTGASGEYSYAIQINNDVNQVLRNAQALSEYIQRLDNDALAALATLVPEPDTIPRFTESGADLISLPDLTNEIGAVTVEGDVAPGHLVQFGEEGKAISDSGETIESIKAAMRGKALADFDTAPFVLFDHRGMPGVFPEGTIEGLAGAIAAGAWAVEVDVWSLSDGSLAVMHDSTVDRITSSAGDVSLFSAASWQRLVADVPNYLGGRNAHNLGVPLLSDVIREFGNKVVMIIEPKDTGKGTGQKIVDLLLAYGIQPETVLINGFNAGELAPALAAGFPTQLTFGTYDGSPAPAELLQAGYRWIAVGQGTSAANILALRAAGLKVSTYTINRRSELFKWQGQVDGIYSDDRRYLLGDARRTTDPFDLGTWWFGHLAGNSNGANGGRGDFTADGKWGYNLASANIFASSLMGWANPMKGAETCPSVVIDYKVTFASALDPGRWVSFLISTDDSAIADNDTSIVPSTFSGYSFYCRKNGTVSIARYDKGVLGNPANVEVPGTAIADGAIASYRITITPTTLRFERLDVSTVNVVEDATHRGSYLHVGMRGVNAQISDVQIL